MTNLGSKNSQITWLDRLPGVFFAAMRKLFADNQGFGKLYHQGPEVTRPVPNTKTILLNEDNFTVMVSQLSTPLGDGSVINVGIWYCGKPVWSMSCHDWHREGVSDFLRNTLLSAYEMEVFFAGLGSELCTDGVFTYQNTISEDSTWHRFLCRAEITVNKSQEAVGWCDCIGGLICPDYGQVIR